MVGKLLLPEILELLNEKDYQTVKEIISDWHPADVAELISSLPESFQFMVFRLLPKNLHRTFSNISLWTHKKIYLNSWETKRLPLL
jgi:Mg/Co/Ni transporter MgtE